MEAKNDIGKRPVQDASIAPVEKKVESVPANLQQDQNAPLWKKSLGEQINVNAYAEHIVDPNSQTVLSQNIASYGKMIQNIQYQEPKNLEDQDKRKEEIKAAEAKKQAAESYQNAIIEDIINSPEAPKLNLHEEQQQEDLDNEFKKATLEIE